MYKEIHPLDPYITPDTEEKDIVKLEPFLLKLETIEQIRPVFPASAKAKTNVYYIEFMQGGHAIITKAEADEIKSLLLKNRKDSVSTELSSLTSAIRDLWNLVILSRLKSGSIRDTTELFLVHPVTAS